VYKHVDAACVIRLSISIVTFRKSDCRCAITTQTWWKTTWSVFGFCWLLHFSYQYLHIAAETGLSEDLKIEWTNHRVPAAFLKLATLRSSYHASFVVGFPRGTTSIWDSFHCSDRRSTCCCGTRVITSLWTSTHAKCILRNMANERPMLQGCGDYQVYQLDGESVPSICDGQGMSPLNTGRCGYSAKSLARE
jgi:hypothetical protein